MAGTTGLEPATSAVTGQRSNQLSYVPMLRFSNLDRYYVERADWKHSPRSTLLQPGLKCLEDKLYMRPRNQQQNKSIR